ncbi:MULTISPECIES: hypothetical protein [unclassified Curtobacterium]|uniref:hypothetical protein n=1 Tax=unclassified Curtobacterium TaxID=257496 RepID=UPI0008241C8B|nr:MULTISPECIES: hypothetical protein [unclassified Curtobacterium]WIA99544.1 hypothetical protein QOL15_13620 [Curtobacterium sp. MCBA15_012]
MADLSRSVPVRPAVVAVAAATWWFVLVVVAVVLSFLPAARPWFPPLPRRPREQPPRTVGWDPETGERIVERTDGTSPS